MKCLQEGTKQDGLLEESYFRGWQQDAANIIKVFCGYCNLCHYLMGLIRARDLKKAEKLTKRFCSVENT